MNLDIILPLAVVGLAFILKLMVDRSTTVPDFFYSVFELPVDIMFLALSLMVGLAIAPSETENQYPIFIIVWVIVTVIVVWLWRKSEKFYEADSTLMSALPAIVAHIMSVSCVYVTIKMIGA